MEKNYAEKLKEARDTIVWHDQIPANAVESSLVGAGYFLLGEVDRLAKIEDGLKNLLEMKRQVHEALYQQSVIASGQGYYHGTNGVIDLVDKMEILRGEIYTLEALVEA